MIGLLQNDQLRFLLDACTVSAIVRLRDGEILWASHLIEDLFGCQIRGGMIGMRIDDLIPERLRDEHRKYVKEYAAHPKRRCRAMAPESKVCGRRLDTGAEFPLEITLHPVQFKPGEPLCWIRCFDMTTSQEG